MKRLLVLLAACSSHGSSPDAALFADVPPGTFALASPSLAPNASFAKDNTCDGADASPQLDWENAPDDTGSFAVVLTDTSISLVHWVLYDIPGGWTGLPAGVAAGYEPANVPGAHQPIGLQAPDRVYHGPCPPAKHFYQFAVYSLPEATLPGATMDTTKEDAVDAITAHGGSPATLVGSYMH